MIINGKEYTPENLGKIFDYAMLNHDVSCEQIQEHVKKAIKYNVNGVHCNPYWAPMIADMLEGTDIQTGLCIAFPFGAIPTSLKVQETDSLCKMLKGRPGAVDFVVNVGALRSGDYKTFTEDIKAVVEVTHSYGYPVKSIMENAMLTDEQLAAGCCCAAEAGVDYVKAASGRGGSPRMETIYIMRANIPDHVGIKFAGYGTYNLTQLTIMGLASGADLFGTGYAHDIIEEIDRHYMNLVVNNK